MPDLIPFIATLRCVINAPDEVEANLAADRLRDICMEWLDEDEGDDVRLTQVTATASDLTPVESINILIRARNALVRTRIKECYDLAREVDKTAFLLARRSDTENLLSQYDYTHFLDVATAILERNEEPLD